MSFCVNAVNAVAGLGEQLFFAQWFITTKAPFE